jgi:hypothetical protein
VTSCICQSNEPFRPFHDDFLDSLAPFRGEVLVTQLGESLTGTAGGCESSTKPHTSCRVAKGLDPCPQEGLSDSLAADGRRSRDLSLALSIGDTVAVQTGGTGEVCTTPAEQCPTGADLNPSRDASHCALIC